MIEYTKNNDPDEISHEDINRLLAGRSNRENAHLEDISQTDIDDLLKGSNEG